MAPFWKPNRGGGKDEPLQPDTYKKMADGPRRYAKQSADARLAAATGKVVNEDGKLRLRPRRER